jgi:hypothetical protein
MEITIGSQARTLWNRSLFVSGSQWRTYVNMAICASCVTSSTVSHRSSWPKATGLASWPYCNVPDMMQCTAYHDLVSKNKPAWGSGIAAHQLLQNSRFNSEGLYRSKKRERATYNYIMHGLENAMSHVFLPVGDMALFMGLWRERRGNCTMSSYYLFSMLATL